MYGGSVKHHYLWRIILPVTLIALVVGVVASLMLAESYRQYRQRSNQEIAALVGVVVTGGDAREVITNLRQPSIDQISTGTEVLRQYGYFASDYASNSAAWLCWRVLVVIVIMLVAFALTAIAYFSWRDWHRQRQITGLIDYIGRLNERIYDLHLEENSEDEFSILSNELYKVMVLLRETADNNQKARQDLETALADISHQLRTPLTSMQVMIDNIYEDLEMPVAVRQDFLRSISHQVESMSNLVMTLLNLAKFDNGSIRLRQHPISAGELLNEVRGRLEVLADLQGVNIVIAGDLSAKAKLDKHWQVEALVNIVKNCPEHSQSDSTVKITVHNSPLFLRFTIKDSGEGIASKDLRHIFERFYKAKNSAADSIGIGLSFAKTVIEADNGQITVKSEEGKGTEFTVTYFK